MIQENDESVAALFERAIQLAGGIDDDAAWELINRLVVRRDRAYELAVYRMRSGDALERTLAIYILGVLCLERSEGEPDFVARILDLSKHEKNTAVQQAIVVALRQRPDPRSIPLLVNYARSGEASLRSSVMQTLGDCIEASGGTDGLDVLIAGTRDTIDDVRDWATLELGLVISRDNAKIRDALFARIDDENEDVSRQAITGLARRRDQRMVPRVLEFLTSDDVWRLDVQAAGYLRSKKLLPALRALKEWWTLDEKMLDLSIDLCDIKVEARNFAECEQFRKAVEYELSAMFPKIQVSLACDLSIDGGPMVLTAIKAGVDLSYPPALALLGRAQYDTEAAALQFAEEVLKDVRFGRRRIN